MEHKRKGGAEKLRDRKRILLSTAAKHSRKLEDLFGNANITTSVMPPAAKDRIGDKTLTTVTSSTVKTAAENTPSYFKIPSQKNMNQFLAYHPQQPVRSSDGAEHPFLFSKIFRRESGTSRQWVSYDSLSKRLHCYVCVTFSNTSEENPFIVGMSDWRHVYQRIAEHESTRIHKTCSEAFLLFSNGINIRQRLFSQQMQLRKKQVHKKRLV